MSELNFTDKRYNNIRVSDFITDLTSSNSKLHKEKVIEQALVTAQLGGAEGQVFLHCFSLAYNPFLTYNIKKVSETQDLTDQRNPYAEFFALLQKLSNRELTGNDARDAVEKLSREFDSDEWNLVIRPVFLRDMRTGCAIATFNKACKGTEYFVDTFSCQLASPYGDESELSGKKYLEGKLDGNRVLAVYQNKKITLYSRNGKVFENFTAIEAALERVLATTDLKNVVIDGEVISNSFQELMKQARRKSDVNVTDVRYHIFDIVSLSDFKRGGTNVKLKDRRAILDKNREKIESEPLLKVTDKLEVDLDTAEGRDIMHRYATDCVKAGLEGIMIKDINAPYQCKRTKAWQKWKPVITVDLTIVDVKEGTGKYENNFGAIICEGEDNGRQISVSVGSGFSDEQREDFWKNKKKLKGQVVEIMADVVSQNQDGTYSLRFPRFVRFRGFEQGEKL